MTFRLLILISFSVVFVSCEQAKERKETPEDVELSDSAMNVLLMENDSLNRVHHMISVDSAFVFEFPSTQSREKHLLKRGDVITGTETKGEFTYIAVLDGSKDTLKGWVLTEAFGVIRFTPPVTDSSKIK